MITSNSIEDYREIVTDNPYREMWNQLYYFADVDSVNSKIRAKLDLEKGSHKGNTRKQAQQIAYSIMQADNYFKAAQEVDVSVKPNLIYYGMSSLANTMILYNNDGSFSLDYLRDKKKEKHHGLEGAFSLRKNGSTEEILNSVSCRIYKNSGEPYGHFKNFFESIVPECIYFDQSIFIYKQIVATPTPQLTTKFRPLPDLLKSKGIVKNTNRKQIRSLTNDFNFLTMLKFLPDMIEQLVDNGIQSNLFPGDMSNSIHRTQQNQDVEPIAEGRESYVETNIYINRVSAEEKDYFKRTLLQNETVRLEHEYPHNLHFVRDSRLGSDTEHSPDMTQDLFGAIYFIYQAEDYIQELANFYICFFCTGMLCRYYPDYWMSWLEKNVGFRHLMDSLCSIAIRKFPNLILNQLTRRINHFHV